MVLRPREEDLLGHAGVTDRSESLTPTVLFRWLPGVSLWSVRMHHTSVFLKGSGRAGVCRRLSLCELVSASQTGPRRPQEPLWTPDFRVVHVNIRHLPACVLWPLPWRGKETVLVSGSPWHSQQVSEVYFGVCG